MKKKEAVQMFREADEFFRAGHYEGAVEILDHLDIAFPENRRVMYSLARCLAEMHRFDEALEICNFLITSENYEQARELGKELENHLKNSAKAREKKRDTTHEKGVVDTPADKFDNDVLTKDELLILTDTTGGLITEEDLAGFGVSNGQSPMIWGLVIGAFLVALGAAWITVSSSGVDSAPVSYGSEELVAGRAESLLARMGSVGIVAALLSFWIVNSAIAYGVLAALWKLPSVNLVENLVDVVLFGLILSIVLPFPLVGFIVELVLLRQKYNLHLRGTGIFIGVQAAAYAVCGIFVAVFLSVL